MYSILIPNFNNTNVRRQVRMLSYIANRLKVEYEIVVLDDASTNESLVPIYKELSKFPNVHCFKLPENKGRTYTRNYLAKIARYDWLLFMDSDAIPQTESFLSRFVEAFQQKEADLVFGGVFYGFMPPKDTQRRLRYTFGSQRESKPLSLREKKAYLSVISTCFAIKKYIFASLHMPQENRYGMDVYFAFRLQQQNVNVVHIDATAEVKEIDKTEDFLQKTHSAVETLYLLESKQMIPADYTPLLKVVHQLKAWKISRVFLLVATAFKPQMLRNLRSKKPNMRVFDMYRLMLYLQQANA